MRILLYNCARKRRTDKNHITMNLKILINCSCGIYRLKYFQFAWFNNLPMLRTG